MRVNWLTYTNERDYDRVESTLWIRGYQLFPYLKELGIECLLNAPPDAAPVAVMLRWQDSRALEVARAVKRSGGKVVLDMCVDYFHPSGAVSKNCGSVEKHYREALALALESDTITCASRTIAGGAREHHGNVHVLPDSVDLRHFSKVKDWGGRRQRLRAIWSGVAAKWVDLKPVMWSLARNRCALTIVSEQNPLGGLWWLWAKAFVAYRHIPWHYATFPDAIATGDVCISPRDCSVAYNRGHSFFKIGVFMAQGVPAIASPVPSYLELIGEGRGGWLCRTPDDWNLALCEARSTPDALRQRSFEAREVMQNHTTERVADRWAELLWSLR